MPSAQKGPYRHPNCHLAHMCQCATTLRQHLELLRLIKTLAVVQFETCLCLSLLIDVKVHSHLCKMMLGQSYKQWDVGQLLPWSTM